MEWSLYWQQHLLQQPRVYVIPQTKQAVHNVTKSRDVKCLIVFVTSQDISLGQICLQDCIFPLSQVHRIHFQDISKSNHSVIDLPLYIEIDLSTSLFLLSII